MKDENPPVKMKEKIERQLQKQPQQKFENVTNQSSKPAKKDDRNSLLKSLEKIFSLGMGPTTIL